ncbi:hypothetical protein ZEAMMB73_Zm00001d015690 [Zea mays]|uniref:Uncharacterized protein n=1 Tax=Zea mays TaxID=4577 RepID=A0A1D6H385_MAIZE|nr:hypothetical protein ZEAMMB73_Zm00001d015690 [Zea mays]
MLDCLPAMVQTNLSIDKINAMLKAFDHTRGVILIPVLHMKLSIVLLCSCSMITTLARGTTCSLCGQSRTTNIYHFNFHSHGGCLRSLESKWETSYAECFVICFS